MKQHAFCVVLFFLFFFVFSPVFLVLSPSAQMLELVRTGARWLKDYEGWGAGAAVAVIEQGQEPREFLRHLEQSGGGAAREVIFFSFFFLLFHPFGAIAYESFGVEPYSSRLSLCLYIYMFSFFWRHCIGQLWHIVELYKALRVVRIC